jgi:hypothetical protein
LKDARLKGKAAIAALSEKEQQGFKRLQTSLALSRFWYSVVQCCEISKGFATTLYRIVSNSSKPALIWRS